MTDGGFGRDGSLQKLSHSGVDPDKGADPIIIRGLFCHGGSMCHPSVLA